MRSTAITTLSSADGLNALSARDDCRMDASQNATLTRSPRLSLGLIANATSSLASAGGPTPSDLPVGRGIGKSGPAVVPVSRFRARDADRAMPTNDTSGPLFTASSPSAALQRSLESRLRETLDVNGSQGYVLIWRSLDMPSGPPICQLRAKARPMQDSGFFGARVPTPSARDGAGPHSNSGVLHLNTR